MFVLHENDVDVYPNSEFFPKELLAVQSDGSPVPAWFNKTTQMQSFLLSPIHAQRIAATYAPLIHRRYRTQGTYLDVSTSVNPSEKVDCNARVEGNTRFTTTLGAYRKLLSDMKRHHQGFVLEVGGHHFLYTQSLDAVLAEDAARDEQGADLLPLVHFDLREIHPRITSFGVGFYPWFFARGSELKWNQYTEDEHFCYMAYEIAFGHAGYVPTPDSLGTDDQIVEFIKKKVSLVGVVHRKIAQARVQRILYQVPGALVEVEQALAQKKVRQIHLVYDNGVKVWVNLDAKNPWVVQLDHEPRWVSFSALIEGKRQNVTGRTAERRFVLPPWGWVVAQ